MLKKQQVARVAADPAKLMLAAHPGGWNDLAYFRLHGSPRIYESLYGRDAIEVHAKVIASLAMRGVDVWTIYDNTTHGAATQNAFEMMEVLR